MAAGAGVAVIPWYATVWRGDRLEAAVEEIAPVALRYGATEYEVLRSREDRYRMRQKEILGSHFANAWEAKKANELIEQGRIRPVLWRTMPFDGVAEAHQLMRDNKHLGKIAILVGAEKEGLGKTAEGEGAIYAEVGV